MAQYYIGTKVVNNKERKLSKEAKRKYVAKRAEQAEKDNKMHRKEYDNYIKRETIQNYLIEYYNQRFKTEYIGNVARGYLLRGSFESIVPRELLTGIKLEKN